MNVAPQKAQAFKSSHFIHLLEIRSLVWYISGVITIICYNVTMTWFAFAPAAFLVNSLVLGFFTPDYTNQQDEMSYLVYGKYGKLQTINFYSMGLLTLVAAQILMDRPLTTGLNSAHLVPLGAIAFGAGLIGLRIFPTEQKGQKTIVSKIHKVIFIVSIVSQAIFQISFALGNASRSWTNYLLISGVLTLVGLVSMVIWRPSRGLLQRITVALIATWLAFGSSLIG